MKNLDLNNLRDELLGILISFLKTNDIDYEEEVTIETRLVGGKSIFDSMDLVQFIVHVEEYVIDSYQADIDLTSEKAMSQRSSPFSSIRSLSEFIFNQVNKDE